MSKILIYTGMSKGISIITLVSKAQSNKFHKLLHFTNRIVTGRVTLDSPSREN